MVGEGDCFAISVVKRKSKLIMKLSVNLVSWSGAKYIPYLMKSLRNQTFKDWSLFVLDNNSTDNTVELIKREIENFPVFVEIVENSENLGFSGGHNLAFKKTESDYVLLLNQDTYLMPDYLEKMVKFMDEHQDTAAVSGRLMKWDFASLQDNLENTFTKQIDSLGFRIFKSRRVVEIGVGEGWKGSLSQAKEVFGVSGTLPVYCREALQEVAFEDGNIFDSLYESYKEDVDLAYRLQLKRLKAYILPEVVAYHDRTMAGPKMMDDLSAMKNKRQQSPRLSYLSYRNHLMNLYKNEMWQNFLLDFFPIFWYELKKFVYYLFFNPAVLKGWKFLWQHHAELKNKRIFVQQNKKINWREIRRWFK